MGSYTNRNMPLRDFPLDAGASLITHLSIPLLYVLSQTSSHLLSVVKTASKQEVLSMDGPSGWLLTLALGRARARVKQASSTISAGFDYSIVMGADRELIGFGGCVHGQLGRGVAEAAMVRPSPVLRTPSRMVKTISSGSCHSVAVTDGGDVWAWGRNDHGQLGVGFVSCEMSMPQKIPLDQPIETVTAGHRHTLIVSRTGELMACGESRHGQLG